MSYIQIDYITRRLVEANHTSDGDEKAVQLTTIKSPKEMEADLVIKQLHEKV